MHLEVLLVQFALEVQLILQILDYPSLLLCLEILGIRDHLWTLADLADLVLPYGLVAPGLLQFQVDLLGHGCP